MCESDGKGFRKRRVEQRGEERVFMVVEKAARLTPDRAAAKPGGSYTTTEITFNKTTL
jgi:hypothetical protein